MDYPKRPRFFAYRFCRLMAKACLANECGPEVCWLLTVIAQTEDARGYRSPVTFFNEQLLPLAGCRTIKRLALVREKAIAAGWLIYHPGGKGVPGRYWVEIPESCRSWDDSPTDEARPITRAESTQETPEKRGKKRQRNAREEGKETPEKGIENGGENGSENRQANGERTGQPSSLPLSPLPYPDPREERTPIPPQFDTVEFREAWDAFRADRRDRKDEMSPRAEKAALNKLLKAELNAAQAVATIEDSLAGNWKGLFPENHKTGISKPARSRAEADTNYAAQTLITALFTPDPEPEKPANGKRITVLPSGDHPRADQGVVE